MRKLFRTALIFVGLVVLLSPVWERRPFPTQPHLIQAAPLLGSFYNSAQSLGFTTSKDVALADLDGDDDLDAFMANNGANKVWLNNGDAQFAATSQSLGSSNSEGVALGDVDGDTDIDAIVANDNGLDQVWLNDGAGQFNSSAGLSSTPSRGVVLADLDGDLELDLVVASSLTNTIWINNAGLFSNSGQNLGVVSSYDVAVGDVDGDTDLDLFFANGGGSGQPNTVWLNNGSGSFTDSGQTLGFAWSYAVRLGDVDGDGDLDAVTANWFPAANKIFTNDGSGNFTDSGQSLGNSASLGVALADLDKDDVLDAVFANNTPDGGQVWLNGGGVSLAMAQSLGSTTTYAAALGDLDGDLDVDVFLANFGANEVWLNGVPGVPNAFFDVPRQVNDAGEDVYFWSDTGNAVLPVMLSQTAVQSYDVFTRIETTSSVMTETLTYGPGEQVKFVNLVNPSPNPSETVTLTLSITTTGSLPTDVDVTDRLQMVFVDQTQGDATCFLCFVEWLSRLAGQDAQFGDLHQAQLTAQKANPLWEYYTMLFDFYAPEMTGIVAAHPTLLWQSVDMVEMWKPAINSLEAGNGAQVVITQQMVTLLDDVFTGIAAEAGPSLQAAIQVEMTAVDPPPFVGLNMDEAWTTLAQKRQIRKHFLTIIIKSD